MWETSRQPREPIPKPGSVLWRDVPPERRMTKGDFRRCRGGTPGGLLGHSQETADAWVEVHMKRLRREPTCEVAVQFGTGERPVLFMPCPWKPRAGAARSSRHGGLKQDGTRPKGHPLKGTRDPVVLARRIRETDEALRHEDKRHIRRLLALTEHREELTKELARSTR